LKPAKSLPPPLTKTADSPEPSWRSAVRTLFAYLPSTYAETSAPLSPIA
jgi:hypothetical protein